MGGNRQQSDVRDGVILWDLFDLVVREHKNGVGAWCVGGCIALYKVSEFFSKSLGPSVT